MTTPQHLAKHFKELHFGKNWTWSNLHEVLSDVTVEEANHKQGDFNTIADLAFHIHYYVDVILRVLEGGPLTGSDKESFTHEPFKTTADWEAFLAKMWRDAETMTRLIEQLPPEKLAQTFNDEKYGDYFRNLSGVIEHSHYHMGQIVILKKLLRQGV